MEASPGAPAQPVDYIPYLECDIQERIDVLADSSARGIRDANPENSQLGRQWGEGPLRVNLDATLAPYLIKSAMGSDSVTNEGGGVYTHQMTPVNSSNTPTSLSMIVNRAGVDKLLFPYSVVNTLELSFSDGYGEISTSIMARFPVTSVSGTLVTTSGFYYAFRHATIQVGSDITDAGNSATPLKIRQFNVSVNNNTEGQFVSGNRDVDSYINKNLEVTGSFRVAFEDTTQRDNFYNLTKQAMIVTFLGNGIGNDMQEFIKLRFYKIRIDDSNVDMPNDDYVSQEITFTAEYSSDDGYTMDWLIRNRKSSY